MKGSITVKGVLSMDSISKVCIILLDELLRIEKTLVGSVPAIVIAKIVDNKIIVQSNDWKNISDVAIGMTNNSNNRKDTNIFRAVPLNLSTKRTLKRLEPLNTTNTKVKKERETMKLFEKENSDLPPSINFNEKPAIRSNNTLDKFHFLDKILRTTPKPRTITIADNDWNADSNIEQ
jgi:hypothetical protein